MPTNPTYDELLQKVKTLGQETERRERAEKALRRQNAYLSALHETSLGLINRFDRKELLEAILDHAALLTGTEHGFFYLLEPSESQLQMRVGMGFFTDWLGLRVRPGEGFGGKVWETGRPLVVDNYRSWEGRLPDKSLDALRNMVGIPLQSDNKVVGVLGLARVKGEKGFGEDIVDALGRFAQLALIALDNVGLYENLRHELAERKRTAAVLRESEKRYKLQLEGMPDPVVVYDMQGNATYVNPAFEQVLGWSSDELMGRNIDFVPEENWPETRQAIDNMLAGQKIQLFETRRKTKDGRVLDVQISSTLFYDLDGNQAGNIVTMRDVSAQKSVERELRRYREQLEDLVEARTAALETSHHRLEKEVQVRGRAEKSLLRSQEELEAQSRHLEEVNTALKVLLKQRDQDKQELGENVLSNVKELVNPYLGRLKKGRLSTDQATLVSILEANLNNIVSPFISKLSSKYFKLTPMEIRVANLIKAGRTSPEIADMLFLSKNTVLFHRYNIRTKLGIKNTKTNLASHLLSFDE